MRRSGQDRSTRPARVFARAGVLAAAMLAVAAFGTASARAAMPAAFMPQNALHGSAAYNEPVCQSHSSLCRDALDNPGDEYVGHDEPSIAFRSSRPGSGNDITYRLRLPKEAPVKPRNDGSGGTWTFELRPTFWLGLTLCDTESAPEFTKTCTPDSDANALESSNPASPRYIGKHPGNAFMELQFYSPGYVPQFEGFGCAAHQYCAAMTIDSLGENQNTGEFNTAACDDYILGGVEPINWAYVTKNGHSQAPANPLFTGTFESPNFDAVNPDFKKDLLMSPGDWLTIHMHDTPAGYRVDIDDETSHQSGSMTASTANGFAHVLYTPNSNTCQASPYAFHAEYSTANPRGNTWSAHTTNVSYSDEIGHFEHCLQLDADFNCAIAGADDPAGLDEDDGNNFCVPGSDALVVHINGCFSDDEDFDGPSYKNDWPGTSRDRHVEDRLRTDPVTFMSPTTGGRDYSTIQFETDLPRIEDADSQDAPPFCNRNTGAGCVNPPQGAAFYPFYSATQQDHICTWQEGGPFLPHTINNFGGSSLTEYGPLLRVTYPGPGFTTFQRYNDFNSGDIANPCSAS
jgi:hypothetical protein